MATVQTARGARETSSLGRVLMHEHVFVVSPEIMQNYPEEWGDEEARVNDAIERLSELKAAGIDTILDPTAIGLGRYIPPSRPIPTPRANGAWSNRRFSGTRASICPA